MTQSTSMIAAAIILALGGSILIGWLASRPSVRGWLRNLLRIIVIPAFVIAVAVLAFVMNKTASAAVPSSTTIVVPSETMTVKNGTLNVTLNSTGALSAADSETLTFNVSAPVTDVLVTTGAKVKAGDVLAKVDTTSIDSQVQSAQIGLTEAQDALATLKEPATDLDVEIQKLKVQAAQAQLSSASLSGPTADDVQIAQLNVEKAKNSLWQAQVNRDVSASNANGRVVQNAYSSSVEQAAQLEQSASSITTAQNTYQSTANQGPDAGALASGNASLVSAQAGLTTLLAPPNTSDVRQAEIKVQTAQLSLDAAQKNLDDAKIVAPYDGVVASVDFVKGTMPGTGSISLINTSGYSITLAVDEKDITQVKVGQQVSLRVQAINNAKISGTVTQIDPAPVTSTSGQLVTYNVKVTLNPSNETLRPGMSVIATVTLNSVQNVIVVPNRFITVDATTQKATVKVEAAPGVFRTVPVTLGTRTDSESEVVSGLNIGETLVILPSSAAATTGRSGLSLFPGAGGGGGGFAGGGAPGGGGFAGGNRGGGGG